MDSPVSVVDARGKCCPAPIIETRRALDRCDPGATVRILATDPDFPRDLEVFCKQTGNQIIEFDRSNNEFACLVQRRR